MWERALGANDVRGWFDANYRRLGRRYLRPPEAYRVLVELLEPRPGKRLLDVACGPAHLMLEARARGLTASGVDFSRPALELGREVVPDAELLEADAASLPFQDDRFDYVTCIGALERMPDLPAVLAEQARVAKPSARFCFLVRNDGTLSWKLVVDGLKLRNDAGHQGAASLDRWRGVFAAAGFTVESVLPDQWPLQWRERSWARVGRTVDFSRVRDGVLPLRFANEFIFVLRHG